MMLRKKNRFVNCINCCKSILQGCSFTWKLGKTWINLEFEILVKKKTVETWNFRKKNLEKPGILNNFLCQVVKF